jgi:hypothetical protein
MRIAGAAAAALIAVAACGGSAATTATTTTTTTSTGGAATAPRPFTAEQIRIAMPVGTTIRMRQEEQGKPATIEEWLVTRADDRSVTMASRVFAEDGTTLVEDQGEGESTWTELMEHATFPADATTITDSSVEVPAGNFVTRLYEVRAPDGSISRFHFVMTMPGPPVSITIERNGAIVRSMTMVERR